MTITVTITPAMTPFLLLSPSSDSPPVPTKHVVFDIVSSKQTAVTASSLSLVETLTLDDASVGQRFTTCSICCTLSLSP